MHNSDATLPQQFSQCNAFKPAEIAVNQLEQSSNGNAFGLSLAHFANTDLITVTTILVFPQYSSLKL